MEDVKREGGEREEAEYFTKEEVGGGRRELEGERLGEKMHVGEKEEDSSE